MRRFVEKILINKQMGRCDLDRVYRVEEYNRAYDYAKQNISIAGVKNWIPTLEAEINRYVADIKAISSPERAKEQRSYSVYKVWFIGKKICVWATLALLVLIIIAIIVGSNPSAAKLANTLSTIGMLIIFTIPASVVMMIGEWISRKSYNSYTRKILTRIDIRSQEFSRFCNTVYDEIDNLYLCSLEPSHRETVLMNRTLREELSEQRKEMAQYRKDLVRAEERYAQAERNHAAQMGEIGRMQQRLLQIEEDREKRRYGR